MRNQAREVAVLAPPAGKDLIAGMVKSCHGPTLSVERDSANVRESVWQTVCLSSKNQDSCSEAVHKVRDDVYVSCPTFGADTACAQAASKQSITQIVAFGDSYSDNGTANQVSNAVIAIGDSDAFEKPGELYWSNRYSNGKTAVEVLAEIAGLPLQNFATGGATTGYANYTTWMDSLGSTGLLGQIDKYAATLEGGQVTSNTLHFIFASANDYFAFMDYEMQGDIVDVAANAINNLEGAVRKLFALDAKKFFIVGSSDLTLVSYEIDANRLYEAEAFTTYVNRNLPIVLKSLEKELDIEITYFDVTKVSDNIAANPIRFGIAHMTAAAQPTYPKILPVAPNVDEHYFFDEWHYSRIVHRIIGEAFYVAFAKNEVS